MTLSNAEKNSTNFSDMDIPMNIILYKKYIIYGLCDDCGTSVQDDFDPQYCHVGMSVGIGEDCIPGGFHWFFFDVFTTAYLYKNKIKVWGTGLLILDEYERK